tara:strand:+ start:2520 stop:2639 length:120 start_codon:yes stop_codon:yes gene_type:complete
LRQGVQGKSIDPQAEGLPDAKCQPKGKDFIDTLRLMTKA